MGTEEARWGYWKGGARAMRLKPWPKTGTAKTCSFWVVCSVVLCGVGRDPNNAEADGDEVATKNRN